MTNSKTSLPFRNYKPKRSKVQKRTRYQEYKSELRRDFKKKCGYCCDPDEFCGGMQGFHIDHFAPKSKFPNLKSKYCNLVYSCPFCNGAKSAKWVGNDSSISHDGNKGFIDPCNSEYDRHLKRNANGQILGRTNLGDYMVEHLDLSLLRHQYCWLSQRFRENRDKLLSLIPKHGWNG